MLEAAKGVKWVVVVGVQDHFAGEGVVVEASSPGAAQGHQDPQTAHVDDEVAEARPAERPGEPGPVLAGGGAVNVAHGQAAGCLTDRATLGEPHRRGLIGDPGDDQGDGACQ